jgi:hypothetical protein
MMGRLTYRNDRGSLQAMRTRAERFGMLATMRAEDGDFDDAMRHLETLEALDKRRREAFTEREQ